MFIWTGISYLGEAHKRWPHKGCEAGLLDLTGFIRGSGHMFKTLWQDEPHLHIATKLLEKSPYRLNEQGAIVEETPDGWRQRLWGWQAVNEHWCYKPDTPIAVEVYANCDEVELFLNGRSLGKQVLSKHEDRNLLNGPSPLRQAHWRPEAGKTTDRK